MFLNQIGVLMVWPFTTKKGPFTDGFYQRFLVPLVNIDDVLYFVRFFTIPAKKMEGNYVPTSDDIVSTETTVGNIGHRRHFVTVRRPLLVELMFLRP